MEDRDSVSVSKFLSYVLRHKPESIDLLVDIEGWAQLDELIAKARAGGVQLDRKNVLDVVHSSDKNRFSISENKMRIRATHGHSTNDINISYIRQTPPAILFHGTATRFLADIREQGLKRGERQYVHLSESIRTAEEVGRRHGTPTVLHILAYEMSSSGFEFFKTESGVWLTVSVPTGFISLF